MPTATNQAYPTAAIAEALLTAREHSHLRIATLATRTLLSAVPEAVMIRSPVEVTISGQTVVTG